VKTASTRRSPELAQAISDSVADDNVFTTPETELELYGPKLAEVTPEACTEALRAAWSVPQRHVLVVGNAQIEGDAPAAVAQAYERAKAEPVAAPAKIAEAAFSYTEFGPAGTVTESRRVEDLDATLITFANGVRLNLKKTDFEANQVHVAVRIGNGQLTEPKNQPGLSVFCHEHLYRWRAGRHSADDLQRLLAGKTLGTNFAVNDDAIALSGSTNRETCCSSCSCSPRTSRIRHRPEALRQIRKAIEPYYNQLAHVRRDRSCSKCRDCWRARRSFWACRRASSVAQPHAGRVEGVARAATGRGCVEIAIVGRHRPRRHGGRRGAHIGALPMRGERPASRPSAW
jgi:zinc protease